jgi:3-methyladenine DNA glycosylase AlkC
VAAFKDQLDGSAVERIASSLVAVWPAFPSASFVAATAPGLPPLELKARVQHIADRLKEHLPDDVPEAMRLLVAALGPPGAPAGGDHWGPDAGDARHSVGFLVWPMTQFVQDHGLPHFDESMAALQELTRRFTAEFALRPFSIAEPERLLEVAMRWTQSPDQHLRRLASEGLRPRLPWGIQLKQYVKDPTPLLPVLEALKDDPELYVRRSVANHLNDIAKDHPDLVVEVGNRWMEAPTEERRWLIRHACRTLVKKGHPGALALLGFAVPPRLQLLEFKVAPTQLRVGGTLTVSARLRSEGDSPQRVAIDHVMTMQRAKGKTGEKVFKGGNRTLAPGQEVTLSYQRPLKPVSTRRYYPGTHAVELLINGVRFGRAEFELEL